MTHLDASFLIRTLAPGTREDTRLRECIRANKPLVMSTIAWAEFLWCSADETAFSPE